MQEVGASRARVAKAIGLGGAALAVGLLSSSGPAQRLDRRVFRAVNAGHGRVADTFFLGVTELGSLYASGAASVTLAATGRRSAAFRGIQAALAMWGIGQVLKQMFLRRRPFDALLPDEVRQLIARPQGTSWPSAHPATLTAFAMTAARELGLSRSQSIGLGLVIASVAVSRVYLGVHYPSDVTGGVLLGAAVGVAWSRREPQLQ